MDVELTQDRYVICQDAAKEMLAVAICDHYNRAKERSGQVAIHIIYIYISFYQVSRLKNQLSFFHVRSFSLYLGQAFPPGRFCFDGRVFLVIFLLFVILLRWVESWWNPQQEELLETETQVSGPAKSKDETKELAEMPKSLAKSLDNVCSHYP